ncbi:MAG TPA: type II secretion system F family protein, partial [Polyangia bacterium]
LILLAAVVAVMAAAAGFRAILFPARDEVMDRLDRVAGRIDPIAHRGDIRDEKRPSLWSYLARPFVAAVRPTRADELSRLRLRLLQAGFRSEHAMEYFLASKLFLAAFVTGAFLFINGRLSNGLRFPMDAAVAIWLCGISFLLPSMWLSSKIKQRQTNIERSLPDAMDLLVTCVEAGLGMDAALSRVADEMTLAAPLLATELKTTFLEIQASITRRDAFRRLAERSGVEDLRQLSAVLTQTEMFGTSIAKALRVHSDSMRIRRMQRAEEKAAMVGVKMTLPLILCILPTLMAVVLGPAVATIVTTIIQPGE